jgi:hypothetical protein
MLAGSLFLVLIGGLGFTRAEQDAASGSRKQPPNAESPASERVNGWTPPESTRSRFGLV